ncbi:MAG TPA: pyridoxal-phosphate dependent enzyme [Flavobacterium sp.]
MKTFNQAIQCPGNVTLHIKREDLIHPIISGNKFRKLKYNLLQAQSENHEKLLTFGGAFSNHIAAVACAAQENGFSSIGIIRGDELSGNLLQNPTLEFAKKCGMQLVFVSREDYRKKNTENFIKGLETDFGQFYLLPEGGTNELAIKGCEEILTCDDSDFDYICCAAGTGGTVAGIINTSAIAQRILVFPALKGDFLQKEITSYVSKNNWKVIKGYEFGGYAKTSPELISFINDFRRDTGVPLDPVYTGKMMFGVMDLINTGFFQDNSRILAIHTGGLQGIEGMNIKLKKNQSPLIDIND